MTGTNNMLVNVVLLPDISELARDKIGRGRRRRLIAVAWRNGCQDGHACLLMLIVEFHAEGVLHMQYLYCKIIIIMIIVGFGIQGTGY